MDETKLVRFRRSHAMSLRHFGLHDLCRVDRTVFVAPEFEQPLLDVISGEAEDLQCPVVVRPLDVSLQRRQVGVDLLGAEDAGEPGRADLSFCLD